MRTHFTDLENILEINGWEVIQKVEKSNDSVSGYWIARRYNIENSKVTILFDGMEDLGILPFDKSYGCSILEKRDISLYFSKLNRKEWKKSLETFVADLNLYYENKNMDKV